MTTNEQDKALVSNESVNDSSGRKGDYKAVKFNAMTHGILSRHTVLPHENRNEHDHLLALLVQEHQPEGITEANLVEELAGIIWRKQRVLQAEGARINEGLKISIRNTESVLAGSLPFHSDISGDDIDLEELLRMTPDEINNFQNSTQQELENIQRLEELLDTKSKNYKKALTLLSEEDHELWDEALIDEEREATNEGLLDFIQERLKPWYERQLTIATHHAEIKAQALGESVQPHRLEKLNRYESHLDRKFQRTLGMLIKLKELRNG